MSADAAIGALESAVDADPAATASLQPVLVTLKAFIQEDSGGIDALAALAKQLLPVAAALTAAAAAATSAASAAAAAAAGRAWQTLPGILSTRI